MSYRDMDDLKEKVEKNGNLMTVTMGDLRDTLGYGKLGIHVRKEIAQQLKGKGLGYYPGELPVDQWGKVRIYKRGTTADELIHAVLDPTDEGDDFLREVLSGEAEDILKKIRALVCG